MATVDLSLPGPDGATVPVRVTGIAKGVGMIHPRMATMLAVVLTDATVDPAVLQGLLRPAAARTWDQLSGRRRHEHERHRVPACLGRRRRRADRRPGARRRRGSARAVEAVARDLARQQAADGEGATTLLTCQVIRGARRRRGAGGGPGRGLQQPRQGRGPRARPELGPDRRGRRERPAGRCGRPRGGRPVARPSRDARPAGPAAVDPDRLRVAIAGSLVFDGPAGGPVAFDRAAARAAMDGPEVLIRLDLGLGTGSGEAFGCDLTEAYVIENAEYTT